MNDGAESAEPAGVGVLRSSFETFNQGDLEACVSLLSPDFVANMAGSPEPQHGPDAWLRNAVAFRDAFPISARRSTTSSVPATASQCA
jgi:hypothetical protein